MGERGKLGKKYLRMNKSKENTLIYIHVYIYVYKQIIIFYSSHWSNLDWSNFRLFKGIYKSTFSFTSVEACRDIFGKKIDQLFF